MRFSALLRLASFIVHLRKKKETLLQAMDLMTAQSQELARMYESPTLHYRTLRLTEKCVRSYLDHLDNQEAELDLVASLYSVLSILAFRRPRPFNKAHPFLLFHHRRHRLFPRYC